MVKGKVGDEGRSRGVDKRRLVRGGRLEEGGGGGGGGCISVCMRVCKRGSEKGRGMRMRK